MAKVSDCIKGLDPLRHYSGESIIDESPKAIDPLGIELTAIRAAYNLLSSLTYEQKRRVISWLIDKFGMKFRESP